jgi:hypothetical protein
VQERYAGAGSDKSPEAVRRGQAKIKILISISKRAEDRTPAAQCHNDIEILDGLGFLNQLENMLPRWESDKSEGRLKERRSRQIFGCLFFVS